MQGYIRSSRESGDHGYSVLERTIWIKSKQNCFIRKGQVEWLKNPIEVSDNGMRSLYKDRKKDRAGERYHRYYW